MPSPLTILYTLIGGLILTALVAWVRRNRLALLVPKLFTYSHLSQLGQLVELTIFNRGFSTEEAVEVFLNPRLSYELVGSTAQNVSITADKLDIARIGASGDVTVILLVEKGQFGTGDVLSCMSKQTTGKQYASLELVPATGYQRIAGLIIFVLCPALLALGFLYFTNAFDPPAIPGTKDEVANTKPKTPEPPAGWTTGRSEALLGGVLYKSFMADQITPDIGNVSFQRDVATVPITFNNATNSPIKVTVSMDSAHADEKFNFFDRRISDVLVLPGRTITKSLKVVIPENIQDPAEKNVFIECYIENIGNGDTITIRRTLVANR